MRIKVRNRAVLERHRWFAWRPVITREGYLIWMETIWRWPTPDFRFPYKWVYSFYEPRRKRELELNHKPSKVEVSEVPQVAEVDKEASPL